MKTLDYNAPNLYNAEAKIELTEDSSAKEIKRRIRKLINDIWHIAKYQPNKIEEIEKILNK